MDITILVTKYTLCVESWAKLIFLIKAKNVNEIIYICNRVITTRLHNKLTLLKPDND